MSDIHGYLPDMSKYKMDKPYDLLLIAGDILPLQIQTMHGVSRDWVLEDFYGWCSELLEDGFVYKIAYIPGNHDFIFDQDLMNHLVYSAKTPESIYPNDRIHLLIDNGFMYKGWKIWGSPWCPKLKNWAFFAGEEKLVMKFDSIPDDTDVLITHCPPKFKDYGKILQPFKPKIDCGCEELYDAVSKKPDIKLHVFGHIHSGDHEVGENENGTKFANVSIKNEDYIPNYEPLIIELQK